MRQGCRKCEGDFAPHTPDFVWPGCRPELGMGGTASRRAMTNKAVLLTDYVDGGSVRPDHFQLADVALPEAGNLQDGEVLVELEYLSVDPYMRVRCGVAGQGVLKVQTISLLNTCACACLQQGRMRNTPGYFVGPFQPGHPIDSRCICRIIASRAAHLPVGSHAAASLKWQQVQVLSQDVAANMKPLTESLGVPVSAYLGVLGRRLNQPVGAECEHQHTSHCSVPVPPVLGSFPSRDGGCFCVLLTHQDCQTQAGRARIRQRCCRWDIILAPGDAPCPYDMDAAPSGFNMVASN